MDEQGRREQTPRPQEGRRPRRGAKKGHGIGSNIWFVIRTVLLVGILSGTMIFGIFMYYVNTTLAPTLDVNADDYTMNLSSTIYYENQATGGWEELQTIYGDENRIWVDYDKMADSLWQAAVSIEDERFFKHNGVDWKRTIGAVSKLAGGTSSYGGSTITQQLLKNLTKDNDGTVNRKVREIFRALKFNERYSKEETLELYLNTIYLGQKCYGVQTAAQFYFGKDAKDLSVAESACIVAITNNPSLYGPMSTVVITNSETGVKKTAREMNKDRQELILDKMHKLGYLDEAAYERAMAEELRFTDGSVSAKELAAAAESAATGGAATGVNSWFVDQVFTDAADDLAQQMGVSSKEAKQRLLNGGYKIYATVDPHIQEIVESVYYDRSNLDVTSSSGQALHSAITIVDPNTGNVVAMAGDVGEKKGNLLLNWATALRQCGSSIKPVTVYAPALDAGAITMASTFDDYPVREMEGKPWPKNSPQGYKGWTTLASGVANSVNTVAVQVVEKLGVENSFQFATEKMMLPLVGEGAANDVNTASMGLGGLTRGVSTQDMAAAYATFSNGGVYNSPRLYTKVEDAEGNVILSNETDTHAAVKETTAYFMNELLKGVMNGGTASRYKLSGMACAGKTGTTTDNKDRYFVGYTPYYTAAVWCGYGNPERISYSGNPSASMWHKVMQKIADEQENKSFAKAPGGLTSVSVCADSGLLATDACAADLRGSRARTVTVAAGTAPTEGCNLHKLYGYCTEGKCLAGEFCPETSVTQAALLDYVREDYGESITAADAAYLVGAFQTALEDGTVQLIPCPVHTTALEIPPEELIPPEGGGYPDGGVVIPPVDPNDGYGGGTEPPTEPNNPTTPTEPTTPEELPPDDQGGLATGDDWFDSIWENGA